MEDAEVRLAAFEFLRGLELVHGEALPRRVLESGFEFHGNRVRLVGPQGIFKPRGMGLPLSILTTAVVEGRDRPYEDALSAQGLLHYRYRGEDPYHRDNVGLRAAMRTNTPLIYFVGIVPGWYVAWWPSFVVEDSPCDTYVLGGRGRALCAHRAAI